MNNFTIGIHAGAATAPQILDHIAAAEDAGLDVAWLTCSPTGPDPLVVFGAAALRTSRIRFGTSVVPTFPRHPIALAMQANAVDQLAPNRLLLGVGPSHQPLMGPGYGFSFERPLQHLREYLQILETLLATGSVDFAGERLTARSGIGRATGVTVMASALRPNAFRLCGELADGAISWVCPLPYLRDVAIPAIAAGAKKAGRPAPPLVAHVPVVVSDNREAVYEASRQQVGRYPTIPYYSQMFQDAGFPEAANGELSDRMIDALVVHGGPDEVKARLRDVRTIGAGQLLAMPIIPRGDAGARDRTLKVLGELAAER
jgi:F420-dependent oxidoreductase-like protein